MINMTEKMTQKDYFNELLNIQEVAQNEELRNFVLSRIEQLEKRSASAKNGERKPTKKQKENRILMGNILDEMIPGEQYTITQATNEFTSCDGLSGQKVTAMMNALVKDGVVEKTMEKGTPYFTKK